MCDGGCGGGNNNYPETSLVRDESENKENKESEKCLLAKNLERHFAPNRAFFPLTKMNIFILNLVSLNTKTWRNS